jgi:hypothetical protein
VATQRENRVNCGEAKSAVRLASTIHRNKKKTSNSLGKRQKSLLENSEKKKTSK